MKMFIWHFEWPKFRTAVNLRTRVRNISCPPIKPEPIRIRSYSSGVYDEFLG